jgi:8-oxo-dGTP pyrophosphatase MutT (NUDIX family)
MDPDPLRERLRAALDPSPAAELDPGERLAAVLTPLIEWPDPALVFTLRHPGLSRHPGEISFPGGLQEPGEELVDTARRETFEEIGVDPGSAEILGTLTPLHTRVSGILIVPFVGVLERPPVFVPQGGEITQVLTFEVRRLVAAERTARYDLAGGRRWEGWVYEVDGHTVWGATGWILHELLDIVRKEAAWLTT